MRSENRENCEQKTKINALIYYPLFFYFDQFAIHLGVPIDDMQKVADFQPPEWMLSVPAKHIAKHLPDLDSSAPMLTDTCIYTVIEGPPPLDLHCEGKKIFFWIFAPR